MSSPLAEITYTEDSVTIKKLRDVNEEDRELLFTRIGILPRAEDAIIGFALEALEKLWGRKPLTKEEFIKYQLTSSKVSNAKQR